MIERGIRKEEYAVIKGHNKSKTLNPQQVCLHFMHSIVPVFMYLRVHMGVCLCSMTLLWKL